MTPDHHSQQGVLARIVIALTELEIVIHLETNIQQVQTVDGYMERHVLHNSKGKNVCSRAGDKRRGGGESLVALCSTTGLYCTTQV